MLPVVIAKNSRARAVQLPAWNEALGLTKTMGSTMEPSTSANNGL